MTDNDKSKKQFRQFPIDYIGHIKSKINADQHQIRSMAYSDVVSIKTAVAELKRRAQFWSPSLRNDIAKAVDYVLENCSNDGFESDKSRFVIREVELPTDFVLDVAGINQGHPLPESPSFLLPGFTSFAHSGRGIVLVWNGQSLGLAVPKADQLFSRSDLVEANRRMVTEDFVLISKFDLFIYTILDKERQVSRIDDLGAIPQHGSWKWGEVEVNLEISVWPLVIDVFEKKAKIVYELRFARFEGKPNLDFIAHLRAKANPIVSKYVKGLAPALSKQDVRDYEAKGEIRGLGTNSILHVTSTGQVITLDGKSVAKLRPQAGAVFITLLLDHIKKGDGMSWLEVQKETRKRLIIDHTKIKDFKKCDPFRCVFAFPRGHDGILGLQPKLKVPLSAIDWDGHKILEKDGKVVVNEE